MILARSAECAHLPGRRPPRLQPRPRHHQQQLRRRRTWFPPPFRVAGCRTFDRLGHASTAHPPRTPRNALALAEHQHFGRAAEAVGIAQPPLSKQIAALEREVGTALFDRTPRGVYPTAADEAFLARARRVLEEAAAASTDARRAARGETGRLRIGFMASALLEFLPAVLRHFHANHPEVQLNLEEMSSARSGRAVIDGTCDVSLTRGAPRGAGAEHLSSVPLGRDRLVAIV